MSLIASRPTMIATTIPMRRKSFVTNVRSCAASRSSTGDGSPIAREMPWRTADPGRCDPLYERRVVAAVVTGRSCAAERAAAPDVRRSRLDRRCLFAMRRQG